MRVVLDTNVVVAALRSGRGASALLLRQCLGGELRLLLSVSLALEYEEVLKREGSGHALMPEEVDELVSALCARADRVEPVELSPPMLSDPDDEFIVRLAVQAGADFLVTHNVRHLAVAASRGVSVVTPRELLAIMRRHP